MLTALVSVALAHPEATPHVHAESAPVAFVVLGGWLLAALVWGRFAAAR